MAKKKQSTRDKLIDAATELFLKKGVDRVGVREIAAKADINLSLMNYYFKTKEKLFETIVENLVKDRALTLRSILESDIPIREKIRSYTHAYIDTLIDNPLLVPFLMSVLHRNPERITSLGVSQTLYNPPAFCDYIREQAAKGVIRDVDPKQFYISMVSLIAFPFAIKEFIMASNHFKKAEFVQFVRDRKELVTEMLLGYLLVNKE